MIIELLRTKKYSIIVMLNYLLPVQSALQMFFGDTSKCTSCNVYCKNPT